MKSFLVLFIRLMCLLIIGIACTPKDSFTDLSGPYLGQKPPGMKAETFAPGIISTDKSEGTIWFSENGLQLVLCRWAKDEGIQIMEQKNGTWGHFRLFPNTIGGYDGDFLFSPDASKMVFASQRPVSEGGEKLNFSFIFMMKKKHGQWTQPVKLHSSVNSGQHDSYPCLTSNGNLYFFSRRDGAGGNSDIYLSKPINGKYKTVEQLGESINSDYLEFDAFVSPDESYMIFCSDRPGGSGGEDMFISFKNSDGDWTEAINMGDDVNTEGDEWTPFVTLDGKYLFFSSNKSGNRDVYWVDAKVIELLKQKVFQNQQPSLRAKVFEDGIISTKSGKEMCGALTKDGKEFYFNKIYQGSYSIFVTKKIDGKWTSPKPLSFSDEYTDRDFTMSPDGNKIFFGSNRPPDNKGKALEKLDIYYTERDQTSGEWTTPKNLGLPVNTEFGENYPSVAANGNLYYFSCRKEGWGGCDLYMNEFKDGEYGETKCLSKNVNSEYHDWDACIAPDERFIIFSSKDRPDTHGTQDLYISFKDKNGNWTKAKNMGLAVNSAYDEICPSLSLDGKYLFFTSRRRGLADIYWVSTKIIEKLRFESVNLSGKYMGQEPPGYKPQLFLPGIVSTKMNELNAAFSKEGDDFYFTRKNKDGLYVIMNMKMTDGKWTMPEPASFSGVYQEADPLFSPDGKLFFYVSKKPDLSKGPPHDILYRKKTADGWSEPINPGSPLNTAYNEIYPSMSAYGNLYFNCDKPGGMGSRDIYVSEFKNGVFGEPQNVGEPISSKYKEGDIFIAPDESYVIFTSVDRPGGYGSGDLYICFKENGEWSTPVNMGPDINTKGYDYSPVVTHDGKYFFFTKHQDIYWVSTEIFNTLKTKKTDR